VLKPLLGSYNPVAPLEAKRKIREKRGKWGKDEEGVEPWR